MAAGEAEVIYGMDEISAADLDAADQILEEIEKMLHEMRSLAIIAAGSGLTRRQRARIQMRIDELKKEIDGVASMLMPPDLPIQ